MKKPSILRALHWVGSPVLRRGGFRWEQRRMGDLKIGYWRKSLRGSGGGRGLGEAARKVGAAKRKFVLVPGLGDTPLSWWAVVQLLMPALKKEFDEIVLVDLPGFQGFLRDEKAFHTMDLLMSASHDLLDQLAPHTVFGHSLGGWLVAAYAGECGKGTRPRAASGKYAGPSRVIVANPSGVIENEEKLRHWKGHFDRAREIGFDAYRKILFGKEPRWFRFMVEDFRGFFKKKEVLEFIESVRADHFVTPLLPEVKAEFWLLWGEDDQLVPSGWSRDWLRELRRRSPDRASAAVVLKGVGHSPHLESPFTTALVLARIISSRMKTESPKRWAARLESRLWKIF